MYNMSVMLRRNIFEKIAGNFYDLNRETHVKYRNHPAVADVLEDLEDSEFSPSFFDRKSNNPVGLGGINTKYGPNNAFHRHSDNKVYFGSDNFKPAVFHELGHSLRKVRGLYPRHYGSDRKYNNIDELYTNARETDQEEAGASWFGAQIAKRYGMSDDAANDLASSGLHSYRNNFAHKMGWLDKHKATLDPALKYSGPINNRPIARPAYTPEEQMQALQEEYNIQHSPGRMLYMPLGKRPAGFEYDGRFVPGMKPVSPDEWRMDDIVHGRNIEGLTPTDATYASRNYMRAALNGEEKNPRLMNHFELQRWNDNYRDQNELKKTRKGYTDPYDLGKAVATNFHRMATRPTYKQFKEGWLPHYEEATSAPLYMDKNRPEDIQRYRNGLRGFWPEGDHMSLGEEQYRRYINSYDSDVDKQNRTAWLKWKQAQQQQQQQQPPVNGIANR